MFCTEPDRFQISCQKFLDPVVGVRYVRVRSPPAAWARVDREPRAEKKKTIRIYTSIPKQFQAIAQALAIVFSAGGYDVTWCHGYRMSYAYGVVCRTNNSCSPLQISSEAWSCSPWLVIYDSLDAGIGLACLEAVSQDTAAAKGDAQTPAKKWKGKAPWNFQGSSKNDLSKPKVVFFKNCFTQHFFEEKPGRSEWCYGDGGWWGILFMYPPEN